MRSKKMTFKLSTLLAVVVALVLLMAGYAPAADAASSWWQITSTPAPSSLPPGGEGEILVEVANLGDTAANGGSSPITVTDTLPAGLEASSIEASPVGLALAVNPVLPCSGTTTVTCTFEGNLAPYARIEMLIDVHVAPTAAEHLENEVSVTGGETPPLTVRRPMTVSTEPPGFGVDNYELLPAEEDGSPATQAGSHPFQLTTTLNMNAKLEEVWWPFGNKFVTEVWPDEMAKDLHFKLPPGLIGNPTAVPECSEHDFATLAKGAFGNLCPADTAIGIATVVVTNPFSQRPMPDVITVPLFNLVPSHGEPARFGFTPLLASVMLDTEVRTGGDYGVSVHVNNITQYIGFLAAQVTFWGVPGDERHDNMRGNECMIRELFGAPACTTGGEEHPSPFLIMPTSCSGPLQTSLEADSWNKPGEFTAPVTYTFQNRLGEPFGMDGCNRLEFEPSIQVTPDSRDGSTPTGLSVKVHVPQTASLDASGVAESSVKDTAVSLPEGVAVNPAGADGLSACSMTQIGLDSPGPASCPEAAKVGTVTITTPLLPNPLQGAVYLAEQNANPFGSLLALYIAAEDPVSGTRIKLAGEVKLNPATGQLVSTFKNTPQLPFEDLTLHFFGGARAPLATPARCGSYTTGASIAPWSGNAPVSSSSTFQITSGPNGAACSNPLPFAASLTAGSTNVQAGGFSPLTTTISREDGQQGMRSVVLHMPPGLSGMLSHVKLCGETQANAGTCGPESQIGETIVSVGVGGDPYSVKGGKVYITGPYDGAPFGLSIVNPAVAGPFNLGTVVVRAKVEVDPHTAALTVTTDPSGPHAIPSILDGIPLQIRHVNVLINRPEFTFNPTSCERMAVTGTIASTEGANEAVATPFQVANCARLPFRPKFMAITHAHHTRKAGAYLHVVMKSSDGQANIREVHVELPTALPSELPTLQKACTEQQFAANPAGCPAESVVGHATIRTPLVPVPLTGPAYFVSHGGAEFPELVMVLQGYGVTVILNGETFIAKSEVTSSTFKTVPDVPFSRFDLVLPTGTHPALAGNGNFCAEKLIMPTRIVAQSGKVIEQRTNIAVEGCTPEIRVRKHAVHGATATVLVQVPSAGKLIANGTGISRVLKRSKHGGRVAITVKLTKHVRRMLDHHHQRKLRVEVRLKFKAKHGKVLRTHVGLLMR